MRAQRGARRAQVPRDAWMMDMVFSDTGDAHGGFYDANHGLDYHVPVAGGAAAPRPLDVVHVSVEMAPIAKARRARRAPRGCVTRCRRRLARAGQEPRGVCHRCRRLAGCARVARTPQQSGWYTA